jgi:hypothetical protein
MSDRTPTTAAGRALDHELYVVVSQSSGAQFHHRRAILAIEDEVRTQLHETHVCRDCGAAITMPYVKPEARAPLKGAALAAYWEWQRRGPEVAPRMEALYREANGYSPDTPVLARAALEEPTPGPQYTEDDPDWSAMVSPISDTDGGHSER